MTRQIFWIQILTTLHLVTSPLPTSAQTFEYRAKASNQNYFATRQNKFSRSRFTAEGSASSDLSDHWSAEASARAYFDPRIQHSQYPASVKRDEEWEARIRSATLEYHALPWKVRLGLQQVVWGEALHYFSADLLHPKDLRDFFLSDLEWARIPQAGLHISFDDGSQNFQFVYFAYTEPHRLPRPGSEFYLQSYGAEALGVATLPEESKYDFSKPTVGANYGRRIGDFDVHAMLVYGKDFQRHLENGKFRHDRIFTGALTASYVWDDFLIRFEETLFYKRTVNTLSPTLIIGQKKVSQTITLPVIEYNLTDHLTVSQQVFWLETYDGPEGQILSKRTIQHGSTLSARDLIFKLEFETSFWAEYKDPSYWWSAKLKRGFGDHLNATLGLDAFMGEGSTTYSELRNRDQISGKVEYSF